MRSSRKILLTISITPLLLIFFCAGIYAQTGQRLIAKNTDSLRSKQEIIKIRGLANELFDSAIFVSKEHTTIGYRLFRPAPSKNKYPLVVFFHGSGAIGTDNRSQLGILPKLFAGPDVQADHPAFILAPQFAARSANYFMDSSRKLLASIPGAGLYAALELIDSLKQDPAIDTNRIYAVGFSMGGSTVINALALRPGMFAAGISISGIPLFNKLKQLAKTPIWLIHGTDDTENPIDSDVQLYKELRSKNNMLFWKLKGTTHDNVFTSTLLGQTLPHWLFGHYKKRQ